MRKLVDMTAKSGQWGSLLLLSFIWGSSFILMKKGLQSYSPQQVAGFRVFLSYIFIMPLSIRHLGKINRQNLFSLLVVGFIGIAVPALLFTTAQTRIDSSLAGVLNALTPLGTLIVGLILYHSKTKWINVLGIFIGLLGALALIKYTTALFASSVTYVIPLFAIMWGIFDGEQLQLIQLLWVTLILFGVYLVNR